MNFEQLINWIKNSHCGHIQIYANGTRFFVFPITADNEETSNVRANAPIIAKTDEIIDKVQNLKDMGYFAADSTYKFVLKPNSNSKENSVSTLIGYYKESGANKQSSHGPVVLQNSEEEKKLREELHKKEMELIAYKNEVQMEKVENAFASKIESLKYEMELERAKSENKFEKIIEQFAPLLINMFAKNMKLPKGQMPKVGGSNYQVEQVETDTDDDTELIVGSVQKLTNSLGEEKAKKLLERMKNADQEELNMLYSMIFSGDE